MPFKYDEAGNIAVQDVGGKKLPVFIGSDGKEVPFDADQAVGKISSLNGEAMSHRQRAETAEASLKSFEGITDPAAALKALETVKNLDDKKLVDAGEVEKVKAEAIKSVEDKYAPTVQRAADLEAQLNQHLIGGAFSGSKFIAEKFAAEGPAGVEIARALFANRFKVEDGKLVAYDAAGGKIYSRTRHGELADADEAIELMVDAYPHKAHILKGSGASGSGAHGGNGAGGKKTMTRAQFSQLSPADQAKAATEAVITD